MFCNLDILKKANTKNSIRSSGLVQILKMFVMLEATRSIPVALECKC